MLLWIKAFVKNINKQKPFHSPMYLMYVKDCSDWCLVNEGATDIQGLESLHNSLSGVHTHTRKNDSVAVSPELCTLTYFLFVHQKILIYVKIINFHTANHVLPKKYVIDKIDR